MTTDVTATSDSENADSDTSTDQKFSLIWADTNGAWPGTNFVTLPATLGTVKFKISDTADAASLGTKINFTSSNSPTGYSFDGTAVTIGEVTPVDNPATIYGDKTVSGDEVEGIYGAISATDADGTAFAGCHGRRHVVGAD